LKLFSTYSEHNWHEKEKEKGKKDLLIIGHKTLMFQKKKYG